jgi:hypothetical protein
MTPDSRQNIYVELDALLDTRFGTLWQMSPELAESVLYLKYHERMVDNFSLLNPAIDHSVYEAAYAKRDVETLKCTRVTNLIYLINQISNDLEDEAFKSPHVDSVELTINIYPYNLNESEVETLKDMIGVSIGPMTGVNVIRQPLNALTPRVIKDTYSAVILYHMREWFCNLNPDELLANKSPRIKIICPAIYEKEIPTKEDMTDPARGIVSPFAEWEIEYMTLYSFIFTDIRFFSIIELA